MIHQATNAISKAFEEAGLKFDIKETQSSSYVEAGVSGDNITAMRVRFISTDDDNDVAIRVYSFVRVPQNKTDAMLRCMNEIQNRYRYVNFILDSDNEVTLAYDIALNTANVGDVAVEMFKRFASIADGAYPDIMKCLWA